MNIADHQFGIPLQQIGFISYAFQRGGRDVLLIVKILR